jgi:hypothetical protein
MDHLDRREQFHMENIEASVHRRFFLWKRKVTEERRVF